MPDSSSRHAIVAESINTWGALAEMHRAQETCCDMAAAIAHCRRGGATMDTLTCSVAALRLALETLEQLVDPEQTDIHEVALFNDRSDEIEIYRLRDSGLQQRGAA